MGDQIRTGRPLRLSDQEAAPVKEVALRETEGNFSMAARKLIAEALRARAVAASGCNSPAPASDT